MRMTTELSRHTCFAHAVDRVYDIRFGNALISFFRVQNLLINLKPLPPVQNLCKPMVRRYQFLFNLCVTDEGCVFPYQTVCCG